MNRNDVEIVSLWKKLGERSRGLFRRFCPPQPRLFCAYEKREVEVISIQDVSATIFNSSSLETTQAPLALCSNFFIINR